MKLWHGWLWITRLLYNLAESPTFPNIDSFGKYFFNTLGAWSISNSSVASLPAYTIMAFLPPVRTFALTKTKGGWYQYSNFTLGFLARKEKENSHSSTYLGGLEETQKRRTPFRPRWPKRPSPCCALQSLRGWEPPSSLYVCVCCLFSGGGGLTKEKRTGTGKEGNARFSVV